MGGETANREARDAANAGVQCAFRRIGFLLEQYRMVAAEMLQLKMEMIQLLQTFQFKMKKEMIQLLRKFQLKKMKWHKLFLNFHWAAEM
ncbi:hypothetical protein HPB48_004841 [Haemaphysalis longicornis]|uniref:Uncharacterized protein n=1 Tax=Haemaphysalis longicornis TaxID=44386 RepID=A0A9J6H5Z4_HAELO|nr:hypothetical protein HPB48_004841 [Haemaphysalis longicornis]